MLHLLRHRRPRRFRSAALVLALAYACIAPGTASALDGQVISPAIDQVLAHGAVVQVQVRLSDDFLPRCGVTGRSFNHASPDPFTFTPAPDDPTLCTSAPMRVESAVDPTEFEEFSVSGYCDSCDRSDSYLYFTGTYTVSDPPPPPPTISAVLRKELVMAGTPLIVDVSTLGAGRRTIAVLVRRSGTTVASRSVQLTGHEVNEATTAVQFRLAKAGTYEIVASSDGVESTTVKAVVGPKIARPNLKSFTAKRTSASSQNVTMSVCAPRGKIELWVSAEYIDSLGDGSSLAYKERTFPRFHKGGCRSYTVGWRLTTDWYGYGLHKFRAIASDRYDQSSKTRSAQWTGDSRG